MLSRDLFEHYFVVLQNDRQKSEDSFDSCTQFLSKLVKKSLVLDLSQILPLLIALQSALISIGDIVRTTAIRGYQKEEETLTEKIEKVLLETLMSPRCLTCVVLESKDNVIQGFSGGYYIGYLSSLDKDEDVLTGYSYGLIFAFAKSPEKMRKKGRQLKDRDALLSGEHIQFAGYCLYGCSTEMVIGLKNLGLHQFSLDRNLGLFMLTRKDIKIPKKAQFYHENGGSTDGWKEKITEILTTKISMTDRDLAYFNPGGYVSIINAILKWGGIYLQDEGNVPLLYRANPIAFLIKEGKGLNITGDDCGDVLNLQPTGLHMKIGMLCGSYIDIELIKDIFQDDVVFIG